MAYMPQKDWNVCLFKAIAIEPRQVPALEHMLNKESLNKWIGGYSDMRLNVKMNHLHGWLVRIFWGKRSILKCIQVINLDMWPSYKIKAQNHLLRRALASTISFGTSASKLHGSSLVPRAHGSATIPRKMGTHIGQNAGDEELAVPPTSCVALGKSFNICSSTLWFHCVSTSDTDLIYLLKSKSSVPGTMAAQASIHPHGLL